MTDISGTVRIVTEMQKRKVQSFQCSQLIPWVCWVKMLCGSIQSNKRFAWHYAGKSTGNSKTPVVCNGASQIYYFNNKAASKNSLYINILPSYRFQKFPFYFMSFISFCFLASWLHCVLGCEFRGQGLCLAQFHLLFTVFLYHNLNEPKDGVSCLFFFFLLTISEDVNSCYNFFQKDFP